MTDFDKANNSFSIEGLNFDRDYLRWALAFFQKGITGTGNNVFEANSPLILAELQLKTEPTDDQHVLLHILKDNVATPVYLDTTPGTDPHCTPIPVVLTNILGEAVVNVNIAGDLEVNIQHDGTAPSSVRIGDGTTLAGVTTSNELKVSDVNNISNPTDKFSIARIDTSGVTYKYYGFLDKEGNWYIMRETISLTLPIYEYYYSAVATPFTGGSGWSNRASITYVEFNSAF